MRCLRTRFEDAYTICNKRKRRGRCLRGVLSPPQGDGISLGEGRLISFDRSILKASTKSFEEGATAFAYIITLHDVKMT